MSPLAGPLFAAALLMGLAGALKLIRPDSTRVALRTAGLPSHSFAVRVLGATEVIGSAAVVVLGGRLAGALVAAAYLGFAGFAAQLSRQSRRAVPCGCFGSSTAPVGPLHVGVNAGLAAVGLASTVWPTGGIASISHTPLAGTLFVTFTVLLAWLLLVALTTLPELMAASKGTPQGART